MAGINRLGKAAPKPGSLRPPDPNRRQDLDLFSEGAESDADYMRMVHDIEDTQQNQSGWLFGRGAFDKGDLLYLRDEEEKRRFTEMELRDSEQQQFRKERARVEAEQAAAALRAAQARKDKQSRPLKPSISAVRIKPSSAQNSSSHEQGEPPTKKLKAQHDDSQKVAASQATARPPAALHAAATSMPAAPQFGKAQVAPAVEAPKASLTAMLGDYASDSEESNGDQAGDNDTEKG